MTFHIKCHVTVHNAWPLRRRSSMSTQLPYRLLLLTICFSLVSNTCSGCFHLNPCYIHATRTDLMVYVFVSDVLNSSHVLINKCL
jgi:hypothetical protein